MSYSTFSEYNRYKQCCKPSLEVGPTGPAGPIGPVGPSGTGCYACLISSINQDASANAVVDLTYNQIDISNGVYYDIDNPSHIKVDYNGVYKIGASIQFQNISTNKNQAFFWFKLNGENIPLSASAVYLHDTGDNVLGYAEIIIALTTTDFIECSMSSSKAIRAAFIGGTSDIPEVPSIITTVIRLA
jgi:hypothetical protein